MEEAIKFMEARIKWLDDVIRQTPVSKTISTQHRLVEAHFILYNLLEMQKKASNESHQHP